MRNHCDFNDRGTNCRTSTQFPQTPKGIIRPIIPIDTSRRSTTPSRIQERVSNSPLKKPLSNAINKVMRRGDSQVDRSNHNLSYNLGRSHLRDESPIISMTKKIYYDDDPDTHQLKTHPETLNFIKKYFETMNLEVPLQKFIQKILQQYQTLWGTQNINKIFDDFTYKVADIFGNDYIDLRQLARITKQDGMIGLILRIFKQIKYQENIKNSNYITFTHQPQIANLSRSFEQKLIENQSITGIKNVVQQFMQSMYQAMQNQIYQKFNIEMRRMIIKYRQTQKLLKKINQKINTYADIFDFDLKFKEKQKKMDSIIEQLNKQKDKISHQLEKEKQINSNEKKQKDKLVEENSKLKETLEKYQHVLLTKALQNNNIDPASTRALSSQSRISNCQPLRTSQINTNTQPFKITIDTHVIHKENSIPETKTTIYNPPPISNQLQMQSYESRQSQYQQLSPFSSSRVATIRPISPTPFSPYHSKITRQL